MATARNLYLGIGGSLASNLEQPSSTRSGGIAEKMSVQCKSARTMFDN